MVDISTSKAIFCEKSDFFLKISKYFYIFCEKCAIFNEPKLADGKSLYLKEPRSI